MKQQRNKNQIKCYLPDLLLSSALLIQYQRVLSHVYYYYLILNTSSIHQTIDKCDGWHCDYYLTTCTKIQYNSDSNK